MSQTARDTHAAPLPSLPRYDSPARPGGGPALLVLQRPDEGRRQALAEQLGQAPEVLSAGAADEPLEQRLQRRLEQACVGLQLFICGDEAFLWPLHAVARAAGLQPGEIHLLCHGQARRAVYCVHCASHQLAGASEQHLCHRCGVRLEIRRHFSQRLGAYLGVCADADHPYAQVHP